MKKGAKVVCDSAAPIWQYPTWLLQIIFETATYLQNLLNGEVSVRLHFSRGSIPFGAQFAWRNEVLATLGYYPSESIIYIRSPHGDAFDRNLNPSDSEAVRKVFVEILKGMGSARLHQIERDEADVTKRRQDAEWLAAL